jgi:hypothetical protein
MAATMQRSSSSSPSVLSEINLENILKALEDTGRSIFCLFGDPFTLSSLFQALVILDVQKSLAFSFVRIPTRLSMKLSLVSWILV